MGDERNISKILVVEDDPEVLKHIVNTLDSDRYDIATAEDGVEALERARNWHPDLILLDVMLPRKNGLEVCAELKDSKESSAIKILLITGLTEASQLSDDYWRDQTKADDFISKPFTMDLLTTHVRDLLS